MQYIVSVIEKKINRFSEKLKLFLEISGKFKE